MANPFRIPTPEEIIRKVDENNRNEIDRIAPLIVKELTTRFTGMEISIEIPENSLNGKGTSRLVEIFEQSGWKVKYRSDQCDGPYLDFSK